MTNRNNVFAAWENDSALLSRTRNPCAKEMDVFWHLVESVLWSSKLQTPTVWWMKERKRKLHEFLPEQKRSPLWEIFTVPFGNPETTLLDVIVENARKEVGFWNAVWEAWIALNTILIWENKQTIKVPTSQDGYQDILRENGSLTQRAFLRELVSYYSDKENILTEKLAWVLEPNCDMEIDDLYYPEEYRMIPGYDSSLPKRRPYEKMANIVGRLTLDEKQRYFWWAIHIPFVFEGSKITLLKLIATSENPREHSISIILKASKSINPILENGNIPLIPRSVTGLWVRLLESASITNQEFLRIILEYWEKYEAEDEYIQMLRKALLPTHRDDEESQQEVASVTINNTPIKKKKPFSNRHRFFDTAWRPEPGEVYSPKASPEDFRIDSGTPLIEFRESLWGSYPIFIVQGLKKITDTFLNGNMWEIAKISITSTRDTIILSFSPDLSKKLAHVRWGIVDIFTPSESQWQRMEYDIEIMYEK